MTSPFKDAVAADIRQTFINPAEFAEVHDINGHPVSAVVDSDLLKERGARASASEYAEGVFLDQVVIFVAADDLPEKPVKDEILRLDGQLYLVSEVAEDMGMLEITIQANET